MSDFDPFNSEMDATMSQVVDINTQMSSEDEDCIFLFVNDDLDNSDPTLKKKKKKQNFQSQLKPNFIEAVHWISTQEEVDRLSRLMDSFVSKIKQKHNKKNNDSSSHTYISSNLPIET